MSNHDRGRIHDKGRIHDRGLLVLAALLLAVTSTPASAQSLRLHGGVNHSTILLDEQEPGLELGRRLGRHAGIGLAVPLSGVASLRFEANYHEKGFAADFTLEGFAIGSEAEVTYVEFAPSLVLGGGVIHFLAGPWVAYNLRCTLSLEGAGMTSSGDCDASGDEVSALDLGAAAGLGIGFNLGSGLRAGVEGIGSVGFLNTSPDAESVARNMSLRGRAFVDLPIG